MVSPQLVELVELVQPVDMIDQRPAQLHLEGDEGRVGSPPTCAWGPPPAVPAQLPYPVLAILGHPTCRHGAGWVQAPWPSWRGSWAGLSGDAICLTWPSPYRSKVDLWASSSPPTSATVVEVAALLHAAVHRATSAQKQPHASLQLEQLTLHPAASSPEVMVHHLPSLAPILPRPSSGRTSPGRSATYMAARSGPPASRTPISLPKPEVDCQPNRLDQTIWPPRPWAWRLPPLWIPPTTGSTDPPPLRPSR